MKIYVAGKIARDPDYKQKFEKAAFAVAAAGHTVINPATLPGGMEPADYMRICFAMLDSADAIYLLDDWAESKGATLERDYAEYVGKQIIYPSRHMQCAAQPADQSAAECLDVQVLAEA